MGYSSKHTALSHTHLSRSHRLARLPGNCLFNSLTHLKENTPLSPETPTEIQGLANDSFFKTQYTLRTFRPGVSPQPPALSRAAFPTQLTARQFPVLTPQRQWQVKHRTLKKLKTSSGMSSYHLHTPAERQERGSRASKHNTHRNHVNLQQECETAAGVAPHLRFKCSHT